VSAPPTPLVPATSPAGVGATPADPSSTGAAASPSGTIVVDVAGKVRRPGIATLPLGSRVVDALEAAGGARPGVRLGTLNLARVLTDGEQVVVGVPAPPGVAASAADAPGAGTAGDTPMVNLNTATQAELEELPGVGPVTAQSILAFRSENGAFTAVDELLEVSGIGDATLAKIAPYVTL
jgi:competence protein ComEA